MNHEGSYGCAERQALQALVDKFSMMIRREQLNNFLALVLDAVEFSLQDSFVALKSGFEGRRLMQSVCVDSFSIPAGAATRRMSSLSELNRQKLTR